MCEKPSILSVKRTSDTSFTLENIPMLMKKLTKFNNNIVYIPVEIAGGQGGVLGLDTAASATTARPGSVWIK